MLIRLTLASSLALAASIAPVYAQEANGGSPFHTPDVRAFSTEDLARYGLNEEETARAAELQEQGYSILALTPEEAEAYKAGEIGTTEWVLIGIGVLIILAIA